MVIEKLESIPRATRIRYWHHCTLELYKYVTFNKL